MTHAAQIRAAFPDLNPRVEDLLLLEPHQIAQLPERAPRRELAAVLRAHPAVRRVLIERHPPSEVFFSALFEDHPPGSDGDVYSWEQSLLWEIGDWILYQRAPDMYDRAVDFEPGLAAIVDLVPVADRTVVDAGAGTGQVTFAVAPTAREVIAVEPVANLRRFIEEKARQASLTNVTAVHGFLDDVPIADAGADVVITRQAIGWRLDSELAEVERVLKPDGAALHLTGLPLLGGDALHEPLLAWGYRLDSYDEGGVRKRRYWKQKPQR